MAGSWELTVQHELFPGVFEPRKSPLLVRAVEAPVLPRRVPVGRHDEPEAAPVATCTAIEDAISRVVPGRVVQVLYRTNRSIILSLGAGADDGFVLRAHTSFRSAPPLIAEAAVRLYLTHASRAERRRLTAIVTRWHHKAAPLERSPLRTILRHGIHHDLRAVLDGVSRSWFDGTMDLDITFGSRIARRLMGRHERRSPRSLVVINPVLDHPWITSWYLDYLVFHECLHECIPPVESGRRLLLHPPEFKERERRHPQHDEAQKYERWIMGPAWRTLRAAAQKAIQETIPTATAKSAAKTARRQPLDVATDGGTP